MFKLFFVFLALIICHPERSHRFYEDGSASVIQGNYRLAGACIVPEYGCTPDDQEDEFTRYGSIVIFHLDDGTQYSFTLPTE